MKENYQTIIENYINAYNYFDVNSMVKDLHDDIVFESISNGQLNLSLKGLAAFKKQAETTSALFVLRKQSVQTWVFEDNSVKIEIDYKAVLSQDLSNGIQAGDKLNLNGVSVFEFDGVKIIKIVDRD